MRIPPIPDPGELLRDWERDGNGQRFGQWAYNTKILKGPGLRIELFYAKDIPTALSIIYADQQQKPFLLG